MLTILNTAILTAYGRYQYFPISLDEAREAVTAPGRPWRSAVGHEATASILTRLLGVEVPVNRITYVQLPRETALVFKLRGRPPEGAILSVEDIERIGYDFGLLHRTE